MTDRGETFRASPPRFANNPLPFPSSLPFPINPSALLIKYARLSRKAIYHTLISRSFPNRFTHCFG